jgi:hypothetical protein
MAAGECARHDLRPDDAPGGAAAGFPQHGAAVADAGHHPLPGHVAGLCLGLADFFGAAYKVGDRDGRLVELLLFAGAVYFVICFSASRIVRVYQNKLKTA